LEVHPKIGAQLNVTFLLKREDTIDTLGCGHKARKLSYIVAAALEVGASVLVTAGSVPSNQCLAVAAAARGNGLRAHLLYTGDHQVRPPVPPPVYALTAGLGPTITWRERRPWAYVESDLQQLVDGEIERGERPYQILPGASEWPGILGSLELGLELFRQAAELGVTIDAVVAPAGSTGTCTGLALAARLLGASWRTLGICIGGDREGAETASKLILSAFLSRAGNPPLNLELEFYDGALGAGYDRSRPDEVHMMLSALQEHNLLLDPNYLVKTYIGVQKLIRRGTIRPGSIVAFIHTGGQLGAIGALQSVPQDQTNGRINETE
jgi:1-aminocyclopropane-1-carboxylate deaminase/D-cysteine desulfhydrase-like pyridoxal-dependent ACC family enzyme